MTRVGGIYGITHTTEGYVITDTRNGQVLTVVKTLRAANDYAVSLITAAYKARTSA